MRQHALAAVAIFALSYSAYGADLPVKASEAPRPTVGLDTTPERISIRPVNLAGRKLVSARRLPCCFERAATEFCARKIGQNSRRILQ